MSPRKKIKPNPEAPKDDRPAEASTKHSDSSASNTTEPATDALDASTTSHDTAVSHPASEASAATAGTSTPTTTGTQTPKSGRKWLGGTGSWRSKAPAVVKTAQETIGISVSGGAASELPKEEAKQPSSESPTRFLTKRKSSKSFALPTSTTKITVSSDGSVEEAEVQAVKNDGDQAAPEVALSGDAAPLPPEPVKPEQAANTWGWTSWWSRPDGYTEAAKAKTANIEEASSTPLPGPTPSEEPDAATKGLDSTLANGKPSDGDRRDDAPAEAAPAEVTDAKDTAAPTSKPVTRNTASGSWFWLWSSQQNVQANSPPPQQPASDFFTPNTYSDQTTELAPPHIADPPQEAQPAKQSEAVKPAPAPAGTTQQSPKAPAKASGWAFWYREPATDSKPADGETQKHVGEVAVFDTPSQSHPEAAQFNEQGQPKTDTPEPVKEPAKQKESIVKKSLGSLRGRSRKKADSKDLSNETPADTPSSSAPATPTKSSPERAPTRTETAPSAQPAPKPAVKTKQEPPNLILPEFNSTYRLARQPTFWKQVRQYFLGAEPLAPHLHINPAPPRIKKAVAIGVHGFFPAPIFQRIMGQPTGTSIRFANAAAAAIKEWSEARGYTPEIEQVALEGEGFIAERVNTLWKLLLNWIDHIKSADFVLVACHSQGVPVAMMLVAKLIQFGCIGPNVRVGVCAMAGVNMGPFIEYKTKYFGPTAAELFEFSDPKSLVSQMYLAALDEVLRFGVRIFYVGSIDDQLVSLESSTFSTLSHPYIYRAVFVDGRIHAPDFLTHLVGFTLKLRNLGLPDHGLIRELSPALAGSLYGGEGHSRVYEDPRVYSLAVSHALETTSLPIPPSQRPSSSGSFAGIQIPVVGETAAQGKAKEDVLKLRVKDYAAPAAAANQNPYFLPWAMRGLLEEDFVKKELGEEVEELLGMFEEWKPTAKQLKEVKFRLEAVRSKL
ncbi:hypothetical protein E8E12_003036 [Didymella heteroderae]|uniref:YMC020W-like alpha/beta hydrolase domain-containing protein n=1 Tax=Didymella heteroderae TaxID=1769908 RepID=A0A9P5C643_9PLEO|nr:hypothetical protein E8E12_003036 [Didymella heteroderae]